jgi:hypothetical protein
MMRARKPKASEIWRELVEEALKDKIDRPASVSVAQANKDLSAAGLGVAADRATGAACLRELERQIKLSKAN